MTKRDRQVWRIFSPTCVGPDANCTDDTITANFYNPYGLRFGVYGSFTTDVLMPEYSLPFYWMYRDGENFLVMNPRVWLNPGGVKTVGALFLYPIELWFEISFTSMIGSPFEYQALWSLDRMGNFC